MISIFILGYPQPLQGRPQGGGLAAWGARGRFSPTLPKIMCYINSEVFNSVYFKNDLYFHFRVPTTPTRASLGGGGPEGGLVLYYP